MSRFEVQHYRKIKTAVGLRNVAAHNLRHAIYDENGKELENRQTIANWYSPENALWNQYDALESPETILKLRADRIKQANLARLPQKNAAFAIEGVFSASNEWGADWEKARKSRKDWEKYLADARKWAEKRFGKENILHCAVHFDEMTPHLHVLMVPIIEKEGKNRYSSSEFLGGIKGLKKLQTDYHKDVGQKYGLERGREESRASHTTIKQVHQDKLSLAKRQYLLDVPETPEFNPKIAKKPFFSMFYEYRTTDGKILPYAKYALHETQYQANQWAFQKRLKRAQEVNWYEGNRERLTSLVDEVNKWRTATPEQLRATADYKEKEQEKALERERLEKLEHEKERKAAIERNKGRDYEGRGF